MRLLSVVLVLGVLALAGCGSSSNSTSSSGTSASAAAAKTSTSPTQLATAKFVLHAGLALGAFHRYIYEPLKAGEFTNLLHHKLALLKLTTAAVFAIHELKLATAAAQASPLLSKLVPQLLILSSGVTNALGRLKAGSFKPAEVESAVPGIESIKGAAAAAGVPVKETVPNLP